MSLCIIGPAHFPVLCDVIIRTASGDTAAPSATDRKGDKSGAKILQEKQIANTTQFCLPLKVTQEVYTTKTITNLVGKQRYALLERATLNKAHEISEKSRGCNARYINLQIYNLLNNEVTSTAP